MIAPLFIRRAMAYLDARGTLDAQLRLLGHPAAGRFEPIESLRARFRDALVENARREAADRGEPWEDGE